MPAITSHPNKPMVLAGATAALVPTLTGTTVYESEVPFRLRSLRSAPGVLTQRILRANGTGLLTFAYRLALTDTDYDAEVKMALSFAISGLGVSFADFRADGPGVIPPSTFESSLMEGYVFKFNYGLSVDRPTRFSFITTNAREWAGSGGKLKLITGMKSVALDIACPASVQSPRSTDVAALIQREHKGAKVETLGETRAPSEG